jgi:PP-loop family protein
MKLKSKFTQIVNIKKQNLSKIEANLAKKRSEAIIIDGFISEATAAILAYEMPQSGSFMDVRSSLEILKTMRREKELLVERLGLVKTEILHLEHQYKNANLEFEKMKYLQTQDFKIQIQAIKRAEDAALDEFATIKFARSKVLGKF